MNKDTYLRELRSRLKADNISDADDIIAEYEEHFRLKLADGCSEDEVSAMLGDPEDIASQFKDSLRQSQAKERPSSKAVAAAGLVFTDIFVFLLFILLFSALIGLALFTLSALFTGFILITEIKLSFMPYIPFPCNSVLGVCILSLSVFSASVLIYFYSYIIYLLKKYLQWHKRILAPDTPVYSIPPLSNRIRRGCKRVALATTGLFFGSAILSVFLLFMVAGFKPFWHVWNWFGGA